MSFRTLEPGDKSKKVIALGTSLLACATYFDNNMEDFASSPGKKHLKFLRIARPSLSFDQLSPLLDDILAAKPDILIIERDTVYYRYFPPSKNAQKDNDYAAHFRALFYQYISSFEEPLRQHSYSAKMLIKEAFTAFFEYNVRPTPAPKYGTKPVNILDNDEEIDNLTLYRSPLQWSQYVQIKGQFEGPRKYVNRTMVDAFLAKARGGNMQIVLLDIPRSREANSLIPDSDRHLMDSYADLYRHRYGVSSLHFPDELDLEYFRDYSHLNVRGRELFSRWLLSEIGKIGGGDRP